MKHDGFYFSEKGNGKVEGFFGARIDNSWSENRQGGKCVILLEKRQGAEGERFVQRELERWIGAPREKCLLLLEERE